MKKYIITILILALLAFPVSATNTHTTSLDTDSNQYWSITDASQTNLDITGDFTIMFWAYPSTLAIQGGVNKYNHDTGNGYRAYFHSDGSLNLVYKNANSSTAYYTDNSSYTTDEWQHFAVTCDVSAASCLWYKNGSGINRNLESNAATAVGDNAQAFYVGTMFTASAEFDGYLDDVRVYGDVLTPTEIANYYNCSLSGSAGEPDNLISYWRFDNNGNDDTANDNDLTNNNSATFQSASLPFTNTCGGSEPVPTQKKQGLIMFQ